VLRYSRPSTACLHDLLLASDWRQRATIDACTRISSMK
jgi:hypothetical protein